MIFTEIWNNINDEAYQKGVFNRMSIGDKPRRQSFALGQEREKPRVPSIKEEVTERANQKPDGEISGVRKSLSLFRRRKSMQLDDSHRGYSESRYNPAHQIA